MTPAKMVAILTIAFCAVGWMTYAEHPTARNLRTAIRNTLPLL
jgi:hypothetical protein